MVTIETLDSAGLAREAGALAELLHACVEAGASVSFVLPFSHAEALAFWQAKIAPAMAEGGRRLLVARDGGGCIVGTVQLDLDTPPNQRHRADVAKMLVHPAARRQGIARLLMRELEAIARAEGRWLITLDTRAGDAAQPLYAELGFEVFGVLPHHARAPEAERYEATAYMYKLLAQPVENTSVAAAR